MTFAAITGGTVGGLVALVLCLAFGRVIYWFTTDQYSADQSHRTGLIVTAIWALVCVGVWWWAMAFTLSGDYHAWTVKEGTAEKVAKRLIATDNGMSERYVVTMGDGQPYGIDDTRATLIEEGDRLSLRCKKDYQWGVPREAHGWACRWNGRPS
jgi:hypothetical protein